MATSSVPYDAAIFYHENDEDLALTLKDFFCKFIPSTKDERPPNICATKFDLVNIQNMIKQTKEAVFGSRLQFLLMTESFVEDDFAEFQRQSLVFESIVNQEKTVVPIYLCTNKEKLPFDIPFENKLATGFYFDKLKIRLQDINVETLSSDELDRNQLEKLRKLFHIATSNPEKRDKRVDPSITNMQGKHSVDGPVNTTACSTGRQTLNHSQTCPRGPRSLTEEELRQCVVWQKETLGKGRFRTVHKGEYLEKPVVVTIFNEQSEGKESEDYATVKSLSYLRHPYLLPIVAICRNNRTVITPYKATGNLGQVLEQAEYYTKGRITWKDFVRICRHVTEGLHYLHRSTDGRNPIRHGNLKPSSILLDENFNACLADTGLTPEVSLTAAGGGINYYKDPLIRHKSGQTGPENDIYAFGIVLAQILLWSTIEEYQEIIQDVLAQGMKVIDGLESFIQRRQCSKITWGQSELENTRRRLEETVVNCTKFDGRILMRELCSIFETILKDAKLEKYKGEIKEACVMCHFYQPAEKMKCCKGCKSARFCLGCLTLHYINPLVCPGCGPCSPPIGGANAYALLIAGNDSRRDIQKVFVNDVKRMHSCLIDPRITGIREENIICMYPNKEQCKDDSFVNKEDNLTTQLENLASKLVKGDKEPFLLLYFSCHAGPQSDGLVWQFNKDFLYSSQQLQKWIKNIKRKLGVLLTILDCCFAGTQVLPFGNVKFENTDILQWSSSKPSMTSEYDTRDGSYFTYFLTAGLACSETCPITKGVVESGDCQICKEFHKSVKSDQCIVFPVLQKYVNEHLKMSTSHQTSYFHASATDANIKIGYFNPQPLTLRVLLKTHEKAPKTLLLDMTLEELRPLQRTIHENNSVDDLAQLKEAICQKAKDMSVIKGTRQDEVRFTALLQFNGNTFDEIQKEYDRFDMIECFTNTSTDT